MPGGRGDAAFRHAILRVMVTGAAGHLARAVLPLLCDSAEITNVVALDRNSVLFKHAKIDPLRADLRDASIESVLKRCDALVHLAWTVIRGRMSAGAMRANNIDASLKLFLAARAADVKCVIQVSSAAVYGSGSLVSEHAALQPLDNFLYAQQKAEFETWLVKEFPAALILRPHIILGPNALPLLKSLLAVPFYVKLDDPQPLLQCVHEDDVAAAIVLALNASAAGAFNLAASDTFSYRDIIRQRHRHAFGIPYGVGRTALYAVWRALGLGAEPGWAAGMRHDLTLDCHKARELLGWQPRYSSLDALQQTR